MNAERSSYETDFRKLLEGYDIAYEYEKKRIRVKIEKVTVYLPDFVVDGINIEVKAPHRFVKDSLKKLELAVQQNPDERFVMIARDLDTPIPRWKSMTLRKFCNNIGIKLLDLDIILDFSAEDLIKSIKEDEAKTSSKDQKKASRKRR